MKNKGFTLIELLAVIVILAIIALIAVPIVLNIINESRESAKERSRELYAKAVQNAVMKEQLNGDTISNGHYEKVSDTSICRFENGVATKDCITPEVNGTIPESYTMEIKDREIIRQTMTLKQTSYKKVGNGQWEVESTQDTYAYLTYTGSNVAGPSIGGDASSLSTSAPSDKNYYLKFKLDDDNKVTNSYACVIFDGEEYCLEGGSGDRYGWNTSKTDSKGRVQKLYEIEQLNIPGVSCSFRSGSSGDSSCRGGSVELGADSSGPVYASGDGGYCDVFGGGGSSCGSL